MASRERSARSNSAGPGHVLADELAIRKSQHGRQEILSAAASLFDEVGYHNASIALLAEAAETTKAKVYDQFKSKHDILFVIHEEWIDELLEMSRQNLAEHKEVPDLVRQFIFDIFAIIDARPSQVRVYFEYVRELPPQLLKAAQAKRDRYEKLVEDVIRRGIETGAFREQSVRVATLALFGMCNWGYRWYRADGLLTHHEIAEQLSFLYLEGMSTTSNESSPAP